MEMLVLLRLSMVVLMLEKMSWAWKGGGGFSPCHTTHRATRGHVTECAPRPGLKCTLAVVIPKSLIYTTMCVWNFTDVLFKHDRIK